MHVASLNTVFDAHFSKILNWIQFFSEILLKKPSKTILKDYSISCYWHGEGNVNPFQYSCLGNPMDRGAWRAIVHGVTKESDRTYWPNNNKDINDNSNFVDTSTVATGMKRRGRRKKHLPCVSHHAENFT